MKLRPTLTVNMKFQFSLLLCASISLLCSCSQQDPRIATAQQLIDKAQSSDSAYTMVESLTTQVGPRLAGTASDLRAVSWAQSTLENMGFDRVWLEEVTFPVWQRVQESAAILTPYPQTLRISALGYSGSTDGELIADLIAFDDLEKLRKTNERHIRGKIVFINQRMERQRDNTSYEETQAILTNGVNIARLKGAAAVLVRSVGTDNHRFPHVGSTIQHSQQIPAAALSNPDADQLQRILSTHPLITLSLNIQTSIYEGGQSWNVVAQLDGREQPEQILLLGAHLDSWDLGTGALDNGAGVAIVSSALHLIAELPQRPKRSLRLVLFANEEQGSWGAKQYAEQHRAELKNIVLAAASDLGAGPIWQIETTNNELVRDLTTLLKPLNLDITAGNQQQNSAAVIRTETSALQELKVPIIKLQQDATHYFDYQHTANDTLDKIDPKDLQQNVAVWASVFYLAAESDYDFRRQQSSGEQEQK